MFSRANWFAGPRSGDWFHALGRQAHWRPAHWRQTHWRQAHWRQARRRQAHWRQAHWRQAHWRQAHGFGANSARVSGGFPSVFYGIPFILCAFSGAFPLGFDDFCVAFRQFSASARLKMHICMGNFDRKPPPKHDILKGVEMPGNAKKCFRNYGAANFVKNS